MDGPRFETAKHTTYSYRCNTRFAFLATLALPRFGAARKLATLTINQLTPRVESQC